MSQAFQNRKDIRKVIIPEGVTKIEYGAFSGCSNLESIVLPKTLIEIEGAAFQNCLKLTRIEIPASVQKIGGSCFWACISLQEIVLHDGLTTIEDYAFYNCISLRKLRIPGSVKVLGESVLGNCHLLKHLKLQEGIEELADSCCWYNSALTEITIPSSVHTIGRNAFDSCNNLKTLTLLCENVNPEDAFDWDRIQNLTLPESMIAWAQSSEMLSRCENLHIHYFALGEEPNASADAEPIEVIVPIEDSDTKELYADPEPTPDVEQANVSIEEVAPDDETPVTNEAPLAMDATSVIPPAEKLPEEINTPSIPVAQSAALPSIESLIKRAYFFLEDEDFEQAITYFNRVLDIDPEHAPAYIGLLCAENKLHAEAELAKLETPIADTKLYKRAVQFADAKQKELYTGYNDAILKRLEEKEAAKKIVVPQKTKTPEEIALEQETAAKNAQIEHIQWEIAELQREQNELSGLFAGMKRKKLQKQIDELNEDLRRLRRGY